MEATGIFASDLIIRTAILEGLRDLRANQWKLDYIFASLTADPLTSKEYGQKQIDVAKKWLIHTDISVIVNAQLDSPRFPCITINLLESTETDNTLADLHSTISEDLTDPWPVLAGPFDPVKWNAALGELTLPASVLNSADVFPGMNIVDATGTVHPILDVRSDTAAKVVAILAPNIQADFRGATLKSGSPATSLTLESVLCKESYLLGCHVQGDAMFLTILHSALVFILFHFRQSLFENRGFALSTISSTDFAKNQNLPGAAWSRYISLSGKVQQIWPKLRTTKIDGVNPSFRLSGATDLPSDMDPDEFGWMGDSQFPDGKFR